MSVHGDDGIGRSSGHVNLMKQEDSVSLLCKYPWPRGRLINLTCFNVVSQALL